jgi:hypothetical protein
LESLESELLAPPRHLFTFSGWFQACLECLSAAAQSIQRLNPFFKPISAPAYEIKPDFASLERPRVAFVRLENRLYLAVPLHKAFSASALFSD